VDFGEIKSSTKWSHTTSLRNSGDIPLEIASIRGNCGCTSATIDSSTLMPGHSGEIRITLDPAGRAGALSQYVYVFTNDPELPMARIRLTGRIRSSVRISQNTLSFGQVPAGETATQFLTLLNPEKEALQILGVDFYSVDANRDGANRADLFAQHLSVTTATLRNAILVERFRQLGYFAGGNSEWVLTETPAALANDSDPCSYYLEVSFHPPPDTGPGECSGNMSIRVSEGDYERVVSVGLVAQVVPRFMVAPSPVLVNYGGRDEPRHASVGVKRRRIQPNPMRPARGDEPNGRISHVADANTDDPRLKVQATLATSKQGGASVGLGFQEISITIFPPVPTNARTNLKIILKLEGGDSDEIVVPLVVGGMLD
jgi:hypothetical protein